MKTGLGTSGTTLTFQHSNHRGARRRRTRTRNWKLIWKHNEGELPQSGKRNRFPGSPGSSESPKEVGPKEQHTQAHTSLLHYPRLKRRREYEKQQEKRRDLSTKEYPLNYQLISPKKPYREEGAGKKYLKSWKARTYIQDYSIQQSYHLEWKGR